ncbi:uncharacterized protein LOC123314570 [Coccinella septempunctata]|uniref:uncharacterized protein LOC123314570 n=1 Tax=Coccinella septempunctata TaxID=41139 RepID=UPI001D0740EC|nr:uncharacterized protein LOC123314570 [Coccinella septempunctata]XP_044755856.1 uncharacterized protein LOC123314570 [Coccinella septempunctata]
MRKSAVVPIPPPSLLRKEMQLQMTDMASKTPMGSKITAVGAKRAKVSPLKEMMTPSGAEQVLQKVITEKRLERTKYGEVVVKNIRSFGKDPGTGATIQTEEEFQKLNPAYPTAKGRIKEIVSVVSERNFTAHYITSKKNIIKETTKLTSDLGMDKAKVELLVEEETQDVTNILKNSPPELVNQSSELFPLRKRIQKLKLSPENAGMLEECITTSPITADLSPPEPSPELIATILDTSERANMSKIPTAQIFNSLFALEGSKGGPAMTLSPATPGPLRNVVIPTCIDENVQEDMLSENMEEVSTLVHLTDNKPTEDAFARLKPSNPRKRGRRRRPYKPLSDEDPPWSEEALLISIEAVAARPSFSMHASNIPQAVSRGKLFKETFKGIEYILDCQPLQYCSRVQLRGSQPPPWFPGYTMALSDISDSVKLAKSPSEVLFSAWRSVQPDVFSDDSVVYN